jgi:glutamine cyclotransferase
LEPVSDFSYSTEGWGITHDNRHLIMSDGSSTIRFWDPQTFEQVKSIDVVDQDGPVSYLNELEYIKGEIFSNVWQTDYIVRIDPRTGKVLSRIDLSGLLNSDDYNDEVDCLNGIAYHEENETLLITGKLWPKIFEIKLVPQIDQEVQSH